MCIITEFFVIDKKVNLEMCLAGLVGLDKTLLKGVGGAQRGGASMVALRQPMKMTAGSAMGIFEGVGREKFFKLISIRFYTCFACYQNSLQLIRSLWF